MTLETLDRFAGRAQIPLTLLAYLALAKSIWPPNIQLTGNPKDVSLVALAAIGLIVVGILNAGMQLLVLRRGRGSTIPAAQAQSTSESVFSEIVNQSFQGQEVLLDGYIYIACTFTDVTFVYNNGGTGGFDPNCRVGGNLGFKIARSAHSTDAFFLGAPALHATARQRPIYTDT